jgi:hypothetical protein
LLVDSDVPPAVEVFIGRKGKTGEEEKKRKRDAENHRA